MRARSKLVRLLKRGFTLVEVSLALLVMSVGVLTAYALFPEGLNASKSASDDTQGALFADIVFRSYRAVATYRPWNQIATTQVPVPGYGTVWNGSGATATIIPGSTIQTYRNVANVAGVAVDELALRYKLEFREITPNRRMAISLYVWSGLYGSTSPNDALFYYTELYNTR